MTITLKHPRPVTDEDLLELSRLNPGYQFERDARGELIVTPTGSESSRASAEVLGQLRDWNRAMGRGVVFDSSGGFRCPDGWTRSPDASWVRRDRWDALSIEERRGFAPLCPEAVFEIRSTSQPSTELREKMQAYLANGAQLAVLIDPYARSVEIYRPHQEPMIVQEAATVALDPDLPGFVLDLGPIFTD